MKATTKAVQSLKALVANGKKLRSEAQANREHIRDAVLSLRTREAQWEYVAKEIMPICATACPEYGNPKIEQTKTGSYKFVDRKTGKMIKDGAYNFLRDRLSLTTLLSGVGNTHKGAKDKPRFKTEKQIMSQRDFVLKAFKLLSAKDRAWVIANA